MSMLWLVLALIVAPCFCALPAQAQSMRTYVSGKGSDSNPCTSEAPCLTLQGALAKTLPGGEINTLNSANYGYVTVNQAVSIVAGSGVLAAFLAPSVTGVTISAGVNDFVNLRGLDIDGAGSGSNGIQFTSGAALNIQDSMIRGFTNGINFQPSGSSVLSVGSTLVSNNVTGISLTSQTLTSGVLNDVDVVNNGTGIVAQGASPTSPVNLTVQNSVVANNSTAGIVAGNYSNVTVINSTTANNGVGLEAESGSALLQVSKSTVSGNTTGWSGAIGGVISSGNNSIGGNTNGNTAPPTSPTTNSPSTPATAVSCNFLTGVATGTGAGTCVGVLPTCDGVTNTQSSFDAFVTWAKSWQTTNTGLIKLYIPAGTNCSLSTYEGTFNGIKQLLVSGYGATLSGNYYHLGGGGQYQDNMHSTRLVTANKGDTSVTVYPGSSSQPAACSALSTCTKLFTVGGWALIAGFDLQGGIGFPSNPAYFQYVHITAINSATGVISFDTPLTDTYKSTWPNYNSGNIYGAQLTMGTSDALRLQSWLGYQY